MKVPTFFFTSRSSPIIWSDESVDRKLLKNARKHPPLRPAIPTTASLPSQPPRTHVLIDWENTQPEEADVRTLVPGASDVWLFHGPNQKNVTSHHACFGDRITPVRIARTGKNALDFHLTLYIGYIAARDPAAHFVVISNDKGYGPMLDHAKDLGFAAEQVAFDSGRVKGAKRAPAKRAGPAKVPTKKLVVKKPVAKKIPERRCPLRRAPSLRRPRRRRKLQPNLQPVPRRNPPRNRSSKCGRSSRRVRSPVGRANTRGFLLTLHQCSAPMPMSPKQGRFWTASSPTATCRSTTSEL